MNQKPWDLWKYFKGSQKKKYLRLVQVSSHCGPVAGGLFDIIQQVFWEVDNNQCNQCNEILTHGCNNIHIIHTYHHMDYHNASKLFDLPWAHTQNKSCKWGNYTHGKPQRGLHWHSIPHVHHRCGKQEPQIPSSQSEKPNAIQYASQGVSLSTSLNP